MISRRTASLLCRITKGLPLRTVPVASFASKPDPFNSHQVSEQESLTTNDFVSKNLGLNRFMQKVYNITGLSILGALGTSYAVLSLPITGVAVGQLAIGGMIASLVGLIGSSWMKPEYMVVSEKLNAREKAEMIVARSSFMRKALYGMGIMGLGLSAAPLLQMVSLINPSIVPTALGMTAAIFGGASLVAYRMPKDKMLSYGPVLFGSLMGLIGLQLVGLGAAFFMGPNPFSLMMMKSSSYISVALFTAFIAYDTHFAIKMYESGQPDHLGIAVGFILDFWNIFVSLLRIFSSND